MITWLFILIKKKFDSDTYNEDINQLLQDKSKCIQLLKIDE